MNCPYCKKIIPDGVVYCPECGQAVSYNSDNLQEVNDYWEKIQNEDDGVEQILKEVLVNKKKVHKENKKTIIITVIAIGIFCIIGGYFFTIHLNIEYSAALELMKEEKYSWAAQKFQKISAYKDAEVKLKECRYYMAESYFNDKDYEQAIVIYEELNGFKDSDEKADICDKKIYNEKEDEEQNNLETNSEKVEETEAIKQGDFSKVQNAPFDQKYWIIFTESSRGDRVEASTIDSSLSSEDLCFVWDENWDKTIDLNDMSESGDCNQNYLNESDTWEQIGVYHRLSDDASNIIASNLNVYDSDGNLICKACSYSEIDWDTVNRYR